MGARRRGSGGRSAARTRAAATLKPSSDLTRSSFERGRRRSGHLCSRRVIWSSTTRRRIPRCRLIATPDTKLAWLGRSPILTADFAADFSDHTTYVPDSRAPGDLLTADELAAKLRCSRDWVYRRARPGELPGAIRLESGWLRAREQSPPLQPSGVAQSQPERRASLQKAKRKMKVTVKTRAHGSGGLEANLFWTDAEGRRRRVRRASPFT